MDVDTTTWTIGFVVAGVVVLVVVAVVMAIIATATRVRNQVRQVDGLLEMARSNTSALWQVEATNAAAVDIRRMAERARAELQR